MTLKERYKRFKAWQLDPFDWSYDENEHHHCWNCGNDFAGKYCPYCSQKAGLKKISWTSVLQSTAEVWGLGNRSMLYSLWQLIWRPGYFISDYINGKRQVSFPPVKMLIIMGVISMLIDNLFGTPDAKVFNEGSPVVDQFFTWFHSNKGWGWLVMTCFFIIPTWCLFRYAPHNTKHTLPQGFFITVFMGLQVLIVDDLADFFGDYFYILLPLCYFYAYRQLFGYGFWGNFWRVAITLESGLFFAALAMTITELLTTTPKSYAEEYKAIADIIFCSVVPILVGMYISKKHMNAGRMRKILRFRPTFKQRITIRHRKNAIIMKTRLLPIALVAIIVCSCALLSSAHDKLTPAAQLSILQKQTVQYDSNGKKIKAIDAAPVIRLVVKVDSKDAASTFAQIREAGGKVLSKLGHQAVISIPTNKVDGLVAIEGVKRVDATSKGELKTDVSLVETGVSLIDGTTPGVEEVYTGKGITICLIDGGFDFQHPAFKDADGNTRLRCVYLPSNDSGHKFIVEDDEAGTIEYPGSVFDTPELIATLTTDNEFRDHGTHTAGIAAGSRSPLGFGGMAPEADIVLVSVEDEDIEAVNEIAFQFAAHYAQQIEAPVVLSASMNSHFGPHNGTGTIPELIDELSNYVIPVFSVGNEGGKSVHIYKAFDEENSSMKTLLARALPYIGEDGSTSRMITSVVRGFSRNTLSENDTLMVRIGIENRSTGRIAWQTEPCVITPSQKTSIEVFSDEDEKLGEYMQDGYVAIYGSVVDGKIDLIAAANGILSRRVPFAISLSSTSSIEMDLWETMEGFDKTGMEGYDSYTIGDSEISCGDWTSTPNVISVGNYVANNINRIYTGMVTDNSILYPLNEISYKSSYGVSLNGVAQPVVTAPDNDVVSSINHYSCNNEIAESMQWQGYPYSGMSGTSMSCPTVSGIIALWLQAEPTLTLDGIKEILAATSRNDEFTAVNPIKWGYGKIDAAAGIDYIKGTTAINTISSDKSSTSSSLWYDITGRTYHAKPTAPGIYINAGKKHIVK